MPSVTLTFIDQPDGKVALRTDLDAAMPRQARTPAQEAALHAINGTIVFGGRVTVAHGPEAVPLVNLARGLLNPEDLGLAVSAEVRDRARVALGRNGVEFKAGERGAQP